MRILIATSNPHKVEEIAAIFAQCGRDGAAIKIELASLADLPQAVDDPVEDGLTFEANAAKKAEHYAKATGLWCLADDSGLEVDALGGEPGIRSARYAGLTGPRSVVDPANNRLLLERLGETPAERRTARFVCAMALARPGATLTVVRGAVEGRILMPHETTDPAHPERGRGANGFGYDPLFLLPERGKTTAELSPAEKNAISHRGNAARKMWERLRTISD